MNDNTIGEVICKLRTSQNITQDDLSRGIMHSRELSRIESGKKLPTKIELDALFQRLGKSADRIEYVLSYKEYKILLSRYKLEKLVLYGDYEMALTKIETYLDKFCSIIKRVFHYR